MSLSRKIHLREGEEIKAVVNRHALVYLWQYLLGLIFLLLPAFFMFYLWSWGKGGYVLFGLGLALGLFIIWRAWFFGRANRLVITSERVVDIHRAGWLSEVISAVAYPDIKDVFVERRGISALFNCGALLIETKSGQTLLEIKGLYNPQMWQSFVTERQEEYRGRRQLLSPQMVYASFVKIIPRLSDEQLAEVKNLIAAEFEEVEVEDDGQEEYAESE